MWVSGESISRVEIGREVVLYFETPVGDDLILGRFTMLRGEGVFVTGERQRLRMDALQLDPFAPTLWTYFRTIPKGS